MSDNSVTSFIPHAGHTPRTSVPGSRTSPQPVYGEHTDGEADGHRSKKQGDGAGDERIRCSPRPGSVSVGGDGEASHLDVKKRKDSHGQKSIRRCIVQSHDASQPWEVDDDGLNIDQRHHAIPHGDEPNRFFKIGDSLSKQPLAESEDPWVIESSNSDDIELPEPEIDPCHDVSSNILLLGD